MVRFSDPTYLILMRLAWFSENLMPWTGSLVRLSLTVLKIRRELGWMPPYTMEKGHEETAEWFKRRF
jgi:nucleoside-diphosphate-sugar epimerase